MNVAGCGKSADVFFVDDKWRTDDATDEATMQLRMFGELAAVATAHLVETVAEDRPCCKIDQLNIVGIYPGEGMNVSGVVRIKLRLSQFGAWM